MKNSIKGTIPPIDYFEEGTMTLIVRHKNKLYAVTQKLKDKKLATRTKSMVEANQRRFFGEDFIPR